MKQKTLSIVVIILWTINACIWSLLFVWDLLMQASDNGLLILRGICALSSWIVAIANFIRYRKNTGKRKHGTQSQPHLPE